jgi:DNA-binding FrmR family transcriptional regulator
MGMSMGNTVMGVLVGMSMLVVVAMAADVIVMNMHNVFSLHFSFIIPIRRNNVKTFIFPPHPPYGLAFGGEIRYNMQKNERRHAKMDEKQFHSHDHAYQHAHSLTHSHGHVHENQKAVVNRLARAIGHLEKVKRMVEEGCDCSEVLVQLAAVRSAIDNTGKVILQDHMRHCMVDAVAAGDENAIEDLCHAIERYMK